MYNVLHVVLIQFYERYMYIAYFIPVNLLDLPQEIILKILKCLDVRESVQVGRTCKLLNAISHDPEIWRNFVMDFPYQAEPVNCIFDRHSTHFKTLACTNDLGMLLNIAGPIHFSTILGQCCNLTELNLEENLMITSLQFVKAMPLLKTLNISGCNFLDINELTQLNNHGSLMCLKMANYFELINRDRVQYLVQIPQSVGIKHLNVERSAYLSPAECEALIIDTKLEILEFSPKWKETTIWIAFAAMYSHIQFGEDFYGVLEGLHTASMPRVIVNMYLRAPYWARIDSEFESDQSGTDHDSDAYQEDGDSEN